MPNWCEGNIRFRGKKQNIINLLTNELEYCQNSKSKEPFPRIIYNDECDEIYSEDDGTVYGEDWWIKGTQRCFLRGFHSYIDEEEQDDIVLCIDGFKAAWSIREQGFMELAKKYDVDIRCMGFEKGGMFFQKITFYRDERKKEEYKEYNISEWDWEALLPNNGG